MTVILSRLLCDNIPMAKVKSKPKSKVKKYLLQQIHHMYYVSQAQGTKPQKCINMEHSSWNKDCSSRNCVHLNTWNVECRQHICTCNNKCCQSDKKLRSTFNKSSIKSELDQQWLVKCAWPNISVRRNMSYNIYRRRCVVLCCGYVIS